MNINPSIFREYDIRGIAGRDLTSEFAYTLGLTYAEYAYRKKGANGEVKKLKITVGKDCRLTSDDYAANLVRGLTEGGIDVIRIGTCPTPLTYFSIFHLQTDGGIMITGSHNPADYNGFKICLGKDTIYGDQIQEMKKIMLEGHFSKRTPGTIEDAEIIKPYLKHVAEIIKPKRKLKVVLDAGNGTASTVAPLLFEMLGAEIIPLYCEMDGRFPNHHPDPTVPENLKTLIAKVKEVNADFGVGYDGDSDRIGAVDEKGRVIYGDELMVIFSRMILLAHPGATIISEVKSSNRLYQDIAHKGGNPIMWKTGHSLIKSKMKETHAQLAGEMSGHIFFADRWFGFDDAIYASARLYEILSQSSASLSSLTADLKPVVNTPEIRVDCVEDKKFALIEEATRTLAKSQGKVTTIDGIRVDFDDRWGLIRASNTQPVIVMRFEAQSKALLQTIQSNFEAALSEAALKVGHPAFQFDVNHGHA